MNKKHAYLGILTCALIASGLFWFYRERGHVYTNDATIEGFSVNLSPDILARIITLNVDEGDVVQEGQLITQLEDDILLSQKEETIAQILASEKSVELASYQLEKMKNDYERAIQGYEDLVIPFQEFDHKQKDYEIAKSHLEMMSASLDRTRKELEVINTKLSHTIVTAPMNGVIAKRWVLAGDVMQAGQTMFTMYDLEHVWVTALLEEKKVRKVRIGSEVEIRVDAYPGVRFHGHVFVIKGAAASQFSLIPQDNATGNYTKVQQRIPLKITIDPPKDWDEKEPLYLFPGMNVEVYIKADAHR